MSTDQGTQNLIKLFGMTTLQIKSSLETVEKENDVIISPKSKNRSKDKEYYPQFDLDVRTKAKSMAVHYEVFHCLENSIRKIIREILIEKFGEDKWWEEAVEQKVQDEVELRVKRDIDSSFSIRSDDNLDFANFGELTSIIEKQWDLFNDLFTSKKAMKKVMSSLNSLRGPIAHCCELKEDEVMRLQLTIKDWFRLMELE